MSRLPHSRSRSRADRAGDSEQVVGVQLDAGSRGRTERKPVKPERVAAGNPVLGVERQELGEGFLLPAIQHVALIFRDDQGEPGDLGREIAQLDPTEIGQVDVGPPVFLTLLRLLISASISRISL